MTEKDDVVFSARHGTAFPTCGRLLSPICS